MLFSSKIVVLICVKWIVNSISDLTQRSTAPRPETWSDHREQHLDPGCSGGHGSL